MRATSGNWSEFQREWCHLLAGKTNALKGEESGHTSCQGHHVNGLPAILRGLAIQIATHTSTTQVQCEEHVSPMSNVWLAFH